MPYLGEALQKALELLASGAPELYEAVWISLKVSLIAIVSAFALALPASLALATLSFPGRRLLISLSQTLMAVPTVVVGLLVYAMIYRKGPLGEWQLLFTPTAMVIGQAVLVLPLLISLLTAALQQLDPRLREEAWLLGARFRHMLPLMLHHCRVPLAVALFSGFSRAISEVGCAMMVGGNILGYTRNITTTIALETSKGEFALGIAQGVVLVVLALVLNQAGLLLRRREHVR